MCVYVCMYVCVFLCVQGHDPIVRLDTIERRVKKLRNITLECYQVGLRNYVISLRSLSNNPLNPLGWGG